jgi:RarD protein
MHSSKNDPKSLAMFVSSMVIFGSIGVFRRYIPLPSAFLAFARGILGGLFILAFMKLTGKEVREKTETKQFIWLAFTGAVIGFNWILLFEAYNYTTVAVATLCYYMQPTIVILLSPFVFNEKLTPKKAVCAGVAIVGMILVSGVAGGAGLQSGDIRGILFGLGAAVLYATVIIMNKRISGIDAYQRTTIQLLSAGIVMIPYLLLTGGFRFGGAFGGVTIVLLLIVGIVHTGIAYLMYFAGMDGLRVQSVAILSYIDPVSALLFSVLFLKEPFSINGMIGAALIIGSAIVSEM